MSEAESVGRDIARLGQEVIDLANEYLRRTEVADRMEIDFDALRDQLIGMYRRTGFSDVQANKIVEDRIAELKTEYEQSNE